MESMNKTSINSQQLSVCRCCLAEGCYKDLSTEYYNLGHREVYEELLKNTFDIQIPYTTNVQKNNIKRLICENCIIRLRDASTFKEMVIRSQESFNKIYDNLMENVVKEPSIQNPLLKEEEIKEELFIDDDMRCDDDDQSCNDDEAIRAKLEIKAADKRTNVRVKIKRKITAVGSKRKQDHSKDNAGKFSANSKSGKDWLKIVERRGNGPLLRENSIKLISNSTICVFQWNKSRYRCFCCMEPFSDMNLLREHTNNTHTVENIEKKIITQQNRMVKVEISVLFCKICGTRLENMNSLKSHLKCHDIKFELDEDLLVPFKIDSSNLQCQICFQKFTMFRLLNIHMNKHYQKQVCHICGAGFSNLVFLNLHKSRSHRPLTCKECDINFKNKSEKKEHDISVHDLKIERKLRFPCPYCQQRFYQENFRVQHLVDKHGMKKPEHKCSVCFKVFITRSLCNNHVKKVHLKEKNQECDICHHLFYTKSDVARHKVTHTGDKNFSCSLCNNLFSTKDSLRRHLKRTHVGS